MAYIKVLPFVAPEDAVPGEQGAILVMEQPEYVETLGHGASKSAVERFHLEKYRADYKRHQGVDPFTAVAVGANPPDFVADTVEGDVQLDCAALALQDRRTSYRLFDRLVMKLSRGAGARTFRGVEGCVLSVWFEHGRGRPPKTNDDEVIEPLLDAISSFNVDREAFAAFSEKAMREGLPDPMPPDALPIGYTPDKACGFYALPVNVLPSADPVNDAVGCGAELHFASFVTTSQIHSELQRLVDKHDQQTIDHLLVTAGGPDKNGLRYPQEETAARLLLGGPIRVAATHLRGVTLHFWSSGDIVQAEIGPMSSTRS